MVDPYNPLVQDLTPLNEVKYAARDYPSIFDSLLRRLKIEYGDVYNDYATTAQGIMLIELMAYAASQMQWYLDRNASDCFLETARTRAAVARLVKQIGYKMGAAAAASTILTLTFTEGTTGPFSMPARWKFQGPDGLVYESYATYNQPTALSAGDTIDIPVRQGETRLLTYTSNGSKNQQYRLASITTDRYLGHGTVDVWVDGMLWEEHDFLDFEKTNHYEVGYNDDPPIIQFGDGIAGNIPPEGAEVKIRFVIIDGERGNVKINSIDESIDVLSISGENVNFDVTNLVIASGGQNPETADRARRLAPFSFAARGAAITEQDYEALSNSYTDSTYGSVAKAYAFNPRGTYEDIIFNDYFDGIEDYLDKYLNGGITESGGVTFSGMIALENAISASASALSTIITSMNDDLTNLGTLRDTLETQIGTSLATCATANASSSTASSNAALSVSNCTDANTELDGLITYVQGLGLPTVQEDTIINSINLSKRSISLASSNALVAQTSADSSVSDLNITIYDYLNPAYEIITETPASPAFSLPSIIDGMTTDLVSFTDAVEGTGGLQEQITDIVGEAEDLQGLILPDLILMQERIGELFNDDCMSNYVQVPILGLDVDGNYSAPSIGLINGLQNYLDGIKEVTQNVEVVDGSSILVPADLEILLDVNKDAYIESEIVSDIVATIIGMMKGRDFNQPLYLSDLYENIKNTSDGIIRVNVEITGPIQVPSVIDAKGNLVPAENKIIVFGFLLIKDKNGKILYQV